jgi:aspartyl-tRNA(Asn)/glutamyl-tRNA(Gln) amidotransferase subunit B
VRLQALVDDGTLNRTMARELLEELVQAGGDPVSLAAARGLSQVGDEEALRAAARGVIAAAPGQLSKWKTGNKGMLGFFMKAFGGRANPALCNRIVLEELEAA